MLSVKFTDDERGILKREKTTEIKMK